MSIGTDQSSHSAWHRGASLGAARYVHLAASRNPRSSAGRVAPSPNIADADTSLSLHCGASEWDASSVQWAGMIHDIQTRTSSIRANVRVHVRRIPIFLIASSAISRSTARPLLGGSGPCSAAACFSFHGTRAIIVTFMWNKYMQHNTVQIYS